MIIKFYGVRGSIPVPGPTTLKYGGNTSCVYVELDNGQNVIFDAGTGLRILGQELIKTNVPINIVLSHSHWDHIQGYPFFAPIYQPDRELNIYTNIASGENLLCSLFEQMDGSNFPIKATDLPSHNSCVFKGSESVFYEKGLNLMKKALNHPGGGSAYRIEEDGVTTAYITDNELEPPGKVHTSYDEWVNFCQGVDVLIHDAQYTEDDMPHKHGWGHSLISQVRQLAVDAEVGALVMFHHDPDRTDGELDEIKRENEIFFRGKNASTKCFTAYEGLAIKLTKPIAGGETIYEVI